MKQNKVITILLLLSIVYLLMHIPFLIGDVQIIKSRAPDSNLVLMLDTIQNFGIISFFIASDIIVILASITFLVMLFFKFKITNNNLNKIIFIMATIFISCIFLILILAATKPSNTSIALTLLPYLGGIILFTYKVFFKDTD